MHLTKITEYNQFSELHEQWNNLLFSHSPISLPLTHEWLTAWWNQFNNNRKLRIFTVYDNKQLIAIAPFYEEKVTYRGIPVRQLHLLANGHSPFCDIIYHSSLSNDQISHVLDLLIQENKNDLMVFAKLPSTSMTYKILSSSTKTNNIVIKDSLITPTIQIQCEWDEYYKKKSSKYRKSLRHKLNKFKKELDFTIDCETITSTDHPTLNEIVEISKNSWKVNIKNDLGSDVAGRNFLYDLVTKFGPTKNIQIWIVRKNSKPVAFEFHLTYDGIVFPFRADFDENYKKHSPGSVLEYTALKDIFEKKNVTEYNSCADDYQYLHHWSNDQREHYTVEVFSSNLKAQSLYFLEQKIIPILRYIKHKLPVKEKTIGRTEIR